MSIVVNAISDILPGYTWDTRSSRFRAEATGRYVARRRILELVDAQVNHSTARLHELTEAFYERRIGASVWVEQMRTELRRQHLAQAALGAGGWERLTPTDFGRIGRSLRDDYARIAGTAQDILEGKITLPQALSRVNGYVGSARTQFFAAERDRIRPSSTGVMVIERRHMGNAIHCSDCINYYDLGWQPVGTLPLPGEDSVCRDQCRCGISYREVPATEVGEWIGTKR